MMSKVYVVAKATMEGSVVIEMVTADKAKAEAKAEELGFCYFMYETEME